MREDAVRPPLMRILVVDDDPDVVEAVRTIFRDTAEMDAATSAAEAEVKLRAGPDLDMLICDLRMGGAEEGLDVLRACRRLQPRARRVVLTGHQRSALDAVGLQASDADEIFEKDGLIRRGTDPRALIAGVGLQEWLVNADLAALLRLHEPSEPA